MSQPEDRWGALRRTGRAIRNFLYFVTLLAIVAVVAAGAMTYWDLSTNLPSLDSLSQYQPPASTQILANDGSVVGEFYFEKRYLVPIERIPQFVREAFLAAEDDQFYTHSGVDPISIMRAAVSNAAAGGRVQGGSTITQQVVKQLLLSPKKSYERKLKEMILSLRLERQLSKDQILYLYLNHIYLGSGAYGVAAAANEYFGKSIDQITLAEAALLAGLPQAPSAYSPFKHWPRAKARQRYVLERMAEVGFISGSEAVLATREPISLPPRKGSFVTAPYYVEYVRRLIEDKYGASAYGLGLRVYTALDVKMQEMAERAVRQGTRVLEQRQHYGGTLRHLEREEIAPFLATQERVLGDKAPEVADLVEVVITNGNVKGAPRLQFGKYRGVLNAVDDRTRALHPGDVIRARVLSPTEGPEGWVMAADEDPLVQGAAVVLDPLTGDVKALVGGTNFDTSQFNRATQSLRQPGSAFKPLIFAAALDDNMTPASVVVDAPISFRDNNRLWSPKNYDNKFAGPVTLREALTHSRNVPTIKLALKVGVKPLVTYIRSLGIHSPLPPNLSIALGSSEVTLIELSSVYTAFANHGLHAEPRFITKVTDSRGDIIDQAPPQVQPSISPETAYMITSMLQDVIQRGTGTRAKAIERPAAGKTGTTNDMNDAWFIGYTPQLLAGFWVGFDEKRTLGKGETGGHAAAPIWLDFMKTALADQPVLDFDVPSGITLVPVDRASGRRTYPGSTGAIMECFRSGSEPKMVLAAEPRPTPEDAAEPAVNTEMPTETFRQRAPRNEAAPSQEHGDDTGF